MPLPQNDMYKHHASALRSNSLYAIVHSLNTNQFRLVLTLTLMVWNYSDHIRVDSYRTCRGYRAVFCFLVLMGPQDKIGFCYTDPSGLVPTNARTLVD